MLISTQFYLNGGIPSMDVAICCPLCNRKSHIRFNGKKKVAEVREYLSSGISYLTQDLPLVPSEREFLRSGYCRKHLMMFGEPSKNIRYVRENKERSLA